LSSDKFIGYLSNVNFENIEEIMLDILKMFTEKEAPIGLSSIGLYKTKISQTSRKLRNISGLVPIFNFEHIEIGKNKFNKAY
jgi:hypothetical protein